MLIGSPSLEPELAVTGALLADRAGITRNRLYRNFPDVVEPSRAESLPGGSRKAATANALTPFCNGLYDTGGGGRRLPRTAARPGGKRAFEPGANTHTFTGTTTTSAWPPAVIRHPSAAPEAMA